MSLIFFEFEMTWKYAHDIFNGKKWVLDMIFFIEHIAAFIQLCLKSLYKFNTRAQMHANKKILEKNLPK